MYISKAKDTTMFSLAIFVDVRLRETVVIVCDCRTISLITIFLCLGELSGFGKDERNRLASMLTTMIEDGQSVMCDNKKLYEEAMSQYVKYRGSKYVQENDPRLIAERKAREEEERRKAVAVKLQTLTQHEARIIGCENLCNSTMRMLDIRKYLTSRGWKRDQMNLTIKVSLMNPSVQINIQASDLYSSVTQMVCR